MNVRNHINVALILAVLVLVSCDQGGNSRYVDPAELQKRGFTQSNLSSTSETKRVPNNQRSNADTFSMAQIDKCYKQCLKDEDGNPLGECPDQCLEYNLNYLRGVPWNRNDLMPSMTFQTAFGNSRLGGAIGMGTQRDQLMGRYFRGNSDYLGFKSPYYRSIAPYGFVCPNGDCEDVVIKDYRGLAIDSALDEASNLYFESYKYQIGTSKADKYLYSIQQEVEKIKSSGLDLGLDFSKIRDEFRNYGRAFVQGGERLAKSFVTGASGALTGGAHGRFAGFGSNYQVAGFGQYQVASPSGGYRQGGAQGSYFFAGQNGSEKLDACDLEVQRKYPQAVQYCTQPE